MSFGSMFRSILFQSELNRLKRDNPPSSETGETSCNRCGLCCWRRPPRLTQSELSDAAKFLGKPDAEFFQEFCVVDDPGSNPMPVPVIRRAHQESYAGQYLPSSETFSLESPCVFLDTENGNTCKLHEHKPSECAGFKCWECDGASKHVTWTDAEMKAIGYNGDDSDWDYSDDYDSYAGDDDE